MDCGRDDDADAERRGSDHNRQGDIFVVHELFPEIVRRESIDDKKADDKDNDAEHGVDNGVGDDDPVHRRLAEGGELARR